MMKNIFLYILFFVCASVVAQADGFTSELYGTYGKYKESSLTKRRIKHADIQPLIKRLETVPLFRVRKVGESIEGRNLSLISCGSGPIQVFLWSQMHGDEPTATQAIFDIFNFLVSEGYSGQKAQMLRQMTLHFLPMLNPDGAQVFQRRNALGIDINRDALRLQSPEGRVLKRIRDSLNADFGFNLHDQSRYYNAERTPKQATISYLATAYNYDRDINEVRANAMKVIVYMNRIIQKYAPGQVGRYNDDFEPRAFGDNIAKWGTSLILIESGGYADDREKQEIRKLNYVSILSALNAIATGNYSDIPLSEYEQIPKNDRKLFDVKIHGATYGLRGKEYVLDLGIQHFEVDYENHDDFWFSSRIMDQGDLSTYFGYETLDVSGHVIVPGKIYPKVVASMDDLKNMDFREVLRDGYAYVRIANLPKNLVASPYPVHLLSKGHELPEFALRPGINPTFILEREGQPRYAVINGFPLDLERELPQIKNAMIYR
ncbi:MAG: M14 family zinc carboxypeptidase [Flavobacteriaceae bacterium]